MTETLPVAEVKTKAYEVMFLLSQAEAAQLGRALEHIQEVFRRADAEVLAMRKWDERRLAFEIDKQKRGVYILAYVRCYGDAIGRIERDVQISDHIMRVLVTKADHLTEEEIASQDDRQGLQVEARMRAERGVTEDDERASGVRLGAPERERPAADAEDDGDAASDEDRDD